MPMETTKCPSCGQQLKKAPQRKTKCPSCESFIYSRTRPSDGQKVLVTEAGAAELDAEWELIREARGVLDTNRPGFIEERAILKERFGGNPRDADVVWSLLVKERLAHNAKKEWSLFRNSTFEMAVLLRAEKRKKEALLHYLDVAYLDIFLEQELLRESGNSRESERVGPTCVAPAVLRSIVELYGETGIGLVSLGTDFQSRCAVLRGISKRAPDPAHVWRLLKGVIEFAA